MEPLTLTLSDTEQTEVIRAIEELMAYISGPEEAAPLQRVADAIRQHRGEKPVAYFEATE